MDAPKSLPGAAGHPLFQPRLFFLSWPLLPFAKAAARFVADRAIPYEYHLEPSPRGLMVGAGAAACDGLQLRRLTRSLPSHRACSLLSDPCAPGWRPANLNWSLTREGSAFHRRSWQASPAALFFALRHRDRRWLTVLTASSSLLRQNSSAFAGHVAKRTGDPN